MGDALASEISEAVGYLRRHFGLSGDDLERLEDVKSLNEMSQEIRARLEDAEEMEITSKSARRCLKKLKKGFYDAEAVLDEFLYHVLHLKSEGATFPADGNVVRADSSMVDQERDPSSSTNPHGNLTFMDDLIQKVMDMEVRLDKEKMDWDAHAHGLVKSYQQRPTTVRPQSTSLMGSTPLIGRGDDLKKIKRLLFSEFNRDGNIPVIAIVGMGGLGKTTLAQCVYNDPQVQEYFGKKIWVCVSEEFDLLRLTRAMLESLEQKKCDLTEMDPLQRRLKGIVEGKMTLLVLDDIWEHRYLNADVWEDLCRPLLGVLDGSRIIVTTRSKNVLNRVAAASVHQLPYLTKDDCFMLFSQHASKDRTSDIDSALQDIGKEIANKCRGLPLAAKTLGSLLCGQADAEVWNDILSNIGIWESDDQNRIKPILRLSYQYLPTKLKKCFRYCSVFPKAHQFNKEKLINMWMAHNYITQTERGKKQLEDIGEEYINELVSKSLLEQSQNHEIFQMHDLIHDLARDLSQGEWWSVEDGVFYGSHDDSAQHLSVISTKNYPQEHVQSSPLGRSLLFCNSILTGPNMKDLCNRMKQLRILDMSGSGILNLPDCISDLKRLRYLRLEHYQITELPKTLGSLYLLETLNLNWTKLKNLPDSICFLKRLRYLGLRGTCIKHLPESLGMLDQLHTLDLESCKIDSLPDSISTLSSLRRLICDDEVLCSSEIRKLTNLYTVTNFGNGRHLIVKEFTDLINVDEAKEMSSHSKEHIKVLSLVWNDTQSPMAHQIHGEVLESLGRHPNLRQLYMDGFGGNSLSSWLRDPFHLLFLNGIHLVRCKQLASLPPLENFPHLRHVHIESAKRLQDVGSPFFSGISPLPHKEKFQWLSNRYPGQGIQESRVLFRGLLSRSPWKTLIILDCPNVSSFSVDIFNFIRVLILVRCPQIQISYLGGFASLQHLSIKASHHDIPTDFSSGGFLQLDRLELEDLPNWRSWAGPKEGECPKLQKLYVVGCHSLENFSISCLHSLNDIYVKNCPMLKISRYDSMKLLDMEKYCMRNIQEIKIISHGYDALDAIEQSQKLPYSPSTRLWNLSTVEHLVINECAMLVSISSEELPSSLKSIQLDACSNLRYLQLGSQHAMEYLSIQNCHRLSHVECMSLILRFLLIHSSRRSVFCHLGNLTKLEYLSIRKCVLEFPDVLQLSSTLRVTKIDQSILKVLTIMDCSDWTSLPFSSLESFKELRIIRCSGPAALVDVKWLPSTVKKLEFNECLNQNYFPLHLVESLKELRIIRCTMHAEFVHLKRAASTLKKLEIIECFDLNYFPLILLESLEELRIIRCPDLAGFIDERTVPSMLKKLEIIECGHLTYFSFHLIESLKEVKILRCSGPAAFIDVKKVPSTLKSLEFVECSELTYFPFFLLQTLEELRIIRCAQLAEFRDERRVPSTLKKLEIVECGHLTFFPLHLFESLEELKIIRCSGPATIIDVKRVPSKLKRLEIVECSHLPYFPLEFLENLEELRMVRCSFHVAFVNVKGVPSTLKKLEIVECFDLTYFPLYLLENLKELRMTKCSLRDAFIGVKKVSSILKRLEILECSDLTYFPLHLLENLEELQMIRCSLRAIFIDVKRVLSTLKKLELVTCFDLNSFPIYLLETLEELRIVKTSFSTGFIGVKMVPSTLKKLEIVECSDFSSFPLYMLETLDELRVIRCYGFSEFLFEMTVPSIIKKLEIVECGHLTYFPLFLLPSLEELRIIRCPELAAYIDEITVPSTLKNLEIVEFSNLTYFPGYSLHSWDQLRIIGGVDLASFEDVRMLSLTRKKLQIVKCSNLSYLCPVLAETMEELRIIRSEFDGIIDMNQLALTLKRLAIIRCDNLGYLRLNLLECLEELRIIRCPDLAGFLDGRTMPSTLKKLKIVECYNLGYFQLHFLERLEELTIIRCSKLDGFIDVTRVPSTLQKLEIVECSNLTYLPLHFLESLRELRIIRCCGPTTFIDLEWLPSTLRVLEIDTYWAFSFCTPYESDASNIPRNRYHWELCLPLDKLNALERLKLKDSPQLYFSDEKNLPSTLQELCITGCPKLEKWCERHSQRLIDIRLLNIEEEHHQVDTSLPLSFSDLDDSDIDKDCNTDDDID